MKKTLQSKDQLFKRSLAVFIKTAFRAIFTLPNSFILPKGSHLAKKASKFLQTMRCLTHVFKNLHSKIFFSNQRLRKLGAVSISEQFFNSLRITSISIRKETEIYTKKVDIFMSVSNQLKRKRKFSSKPREINSLKFDGMYITSLAVSLATLQLLAQTCDSEGVNLKWKMLVVLS